jgi:serine-type D-Ala-D-Ala carboxypeptidase (penicillin-binding protein 5/6)
MRHLASFVVAGLVFGSIALIYAQVFSYQPDVETPITPVFSVTETELPTISAPAYAIYDIESGEIFASRDIDTLHPIASVTKLFTAVAILEKFDPESTTTITWRDVAGEGEAGKLQPRQVYSYRELLFPLLLESSNDAADTLMHATGDKLLPAMTSVALEYGAVHTSFGDASGLSPENVSTVTDLVAFSRAVGETYPFVYDIGQLSQYIGTYTGWRNNNPVAAADAYRGGKHGYTEAAGRTLVAQFAESFAAGDRIIGYIILGSDDLKADTQTLRDFVHTSVLFQ